MLALERAPVRDVIGADRSAARRTPTPTTPRAGSPRCSIRRDSFARARARHAALRRRAVRPRRWCARWCARRPERVRELDALGVRFSRAARGFALGREGGHSRARASSTPATSPGARSSERCSSASAQHPRIRVLENQLAVDLILESRLRRPARARRAARRVLGRLRDGSRDAAGSVRSPRAPRCCATGGCGKVYLYTTNPDVATGDGVAMAYRAGAPVANLEFVQFHPTCLYHPQRQVVPAQRGAARRGRGAAHARRHALHAALPPRRPSWRRATSWRARSTAR